MKKSCIFSLFHFLFLPLQRKSYKLSLPRWWNGRHEGLKIPWPEMAVRVRVPLAALFFNHTIMRKNHFLIFLSASSAFFFTSCSKMGALSADLFNVTPNPLETRAGQVEATINGTFPEKYMKKKATVTVVPELHYGNGQVTKGEGATFQGENVMGNNQTISYKLGGRYTMKTAFAYTPEMHKSDMFLSFNVKKGKKTVNIPSVKVASGILATSELYRQTLMNAGGCIAPDSFERVKAQKQEANIKFLVNQAVLRQSELKNNSVKEFVKMLQKINADREGMILNNVEIQAYASPEGGVKFNDKLANKRQNASEEYVKKTLKSKKMTADIDAHYTAQDWDGFQELVKASNIQDKDIILRVLSMYKDPEERERQIRNMSAGFQELATGILPELRRSRLIINYETVGRDDEQIMAQYAADPKKLSLEELLYAATLVEDADKQEEIYKKITTLYDKDYRAYNNIAALEFNKGNEAVAREYIQKAFAVNPKAPEANANLALMALKEGDVQEAKKYVSKAVDAYGIEEVLGNLSIAEGNYAQAEAYFGKNNSNSAALAQLLNKNYGGATATLQAVQNPDALTDYLLAIVNARQGKIMTAGEFLQNAIKKDIRLAKYAEEDIEMAKVQK